MVLYTVRQQRFLVSQALVQLLHNGNSREQQLPLIIMVEDMESQRDHRVYMPN
nr:MAG TPA: hypothetical protein [Caudoviricetes sp.]